MLLSDPFFFLCTSGMSHLSNSSHPSYSNAIKEDSEGDGRPR